MQMHGLNLLVCKVPHVEGSGEVTTGKPPLRRSEGGCLANTAVAGHGRSVSSVAKISYSESRARNRSISLAQKYFCHGCKCLQQVAKIINLDSAELSNRVEIAIV